MVVLTSLGVWGLPQMVQKFYAIRSEKAIDKGTIISTLFALVVAGGCYFLGGFGRLYSAAWDVAANGYDSIVPTMLENLSPALIGVVVILVLSASMSTLSSLVLASSSTLTLDLIKDNLVKDMDERRQGLVMRLLIVVFIAISVVLAIVQYQRNVTFIAQLMGVSWGALAGAFLAPFLYGLYLRRATLASAWVSFAFGVGVMTLNLFAPQVFPSWLQSPIHCGAFAMLAGLVHRARRQPLHAEARPLDRRPRLRRLRPRGHRLGAGIAGRRRLPALSARIGTKAPALAIDTRRAVWHHGIGENSHWRQEDCHVV